MSTSGQDICRQVFDSAPKWLEALSTFSENARQRKSSLVDGLSTPELSTHLTTTVGSTTDSATAGSVPGHMRRADHFATSHVPSPAALKRNSLQHVEVSRSRGSSSSRACTVVLYDASAQERLADTVKSMDRLIYHIKKSQQRKALEAMLKRLSRASNTCEDAAFQMLRNGNCKKEAQHASSMVEHIYEISRSEIMHEQLNERLSRRDSGIERSDISTAPLMPKLTVDDNDQNDGKIENSLPPIRLTSRLAR